MEKENTKNIVDRLVEETVKLFAPDANTPMSILTNSVNKKDIVDEFKKDILEEFKIIPEQIYEFRTEKRGFIGNQRTNEESKIIRISGKELLENEKFKSFRDLLHGQWVSDNLKQAE